MPRKLTLRKRTALVTIGSCLALGVVACSDVTFGSGDTLSRDFAVDDFDQVEIDGAWDATIKHADTHRVTVHIDDNLMDFVEVKSDNGTVKIDLEDGIRVNRATMGLTIETPDLERVSLDGATDLVIGEFDNASLELELDGSSDVIADITTELLEIETDGASDVNITGRASKVRLEIDGSSDLDLADLIAEDVELNSDGSSTLDLRGAANVSGDADGASDIIVADDATVNVSIDGASEVRRA